MAWHNDDMFTHFRSQDNRREWYMVVGLIFGALTFSHWLWGWPIGVQATAQTNPTSGGDGMLSQIPWRHLLEGLPLFAVGILYYLGRRHGKASSNATQGASSGFVAREEYDRMMRSSAQHEGIRGELKQELADCENNLEKAVGEAQKLQEVNRVFQEELSRLPALTIHSAVYGAGHIGREDLPVSPDKLRARNALAMRIENHALVPRDPASEKRKRLIVRYSFETADVREATFWEGGLMILPEQPPRTYHLAIDSVYEAIQKPNREPGTPLLVQIGNRTKDFLKRATCSIDFVALDNQDDSFRIPEACWLPSSNGSPVSITPNVDIGPKLNQPLVLCTTDTDNRKVLPRRGSYGLSPYFLSEGRWRATITVVAGIEIVLVSHISFRAMADGRVIDIKY